MLSVMGVNGKNNQGAASCRGGEEKNMALILTDFNDSIGTITLNNDGKRNALSGRGDP